MTTEEQLDADVIHWTQLKKWIERAKSEEMDLRKSIAARVFEGIKLTSGAYPEGTSSGVGTGSSFNYRAKMVSKWDRKVLEELIVPTLTEAGLTPEEQKNLIKMNPTLSVKAYKALPDNKRLIIDKMIVTNQSTITLDVMPFPKV